MTHTKMINIERVFWLTVVEFLVYHQEDSLLSGYLWECCGDSVGVEHMEGQSHLPCGGEVKERKKEGGRISLSFHRHTPSETQTSHHTPPLKGSSSSQ